VSDLQQTTDKKNLSLTATAIGSLPHDNPESALELIFKLFPACPLWPQLAKVDRHEDMTVQYLQALPAIEFDEKRNKYYFNTQNESFYEQLEEFFLDYEEIISEHNYEKLEKYGITGEFSSAIPGFLAKLEETKPPFAKGHIIGPLTWGLSLCDETGKSAFYDDVLREVIVKGLTLKALWQVKKIKSSSQNTTPIIFMDEPAMSQYGTSALLTVEKSDIINALKEISAIIKKEGGITGVHCCGKTDWTIITGSDVDILNFDAFSFSQSLALYPKEVEAFLKNGGHIAWGIVPTLDDKALESMDLEQLSLKFKEAVLNLCSKEVDLKLVLENSIITPSCGAGGLSLELAQKAMTLTAELSSALKFDFMAQTIAEFEKEFNTDFCNKEQECTLND